ncbi:GNAT family N-acetyltransferase [Phenylobacterium sp.]|jgi:GNAT superfamily N-acetyltransferase|uniref:GNAT family N-acetyltransferase n=1 Tax=Phenylobacterium sp. TaxID=1871053 RepID=UPI0025F123E8|nr:GNAT family N-acetyltransferase [Phenylobacterium sp.]MCA6286142.1 GNAT family N-acetyltransferase [Phenylobacterium sp.]MCA6287651.1 GNAT family N-acetyltransferase [Phenylobacterium sp.]MCA6311774.1 GNAT family N-acetyltransferase [Phenylobacterium sp.]MCA6324920.1 GNAT family N-acetyltransferase [Phenylobacterium sp.]MCA6337034.1 GNAT family N-acetyltransferase [Phenylobacterium sp.]
MTLDGIRFPPPAGGDETFWRLLAASVGDPTIEKMAQVRATYQNEPGRGLVEATVGGVQVAAAGFRQDHEGVEITHIAVAPERRNSGYGRALIEAISRAYPGLPIHAETHSGATGFYLKLGFAVEALPPKAGWAPRFRCLRIADI